MHVVANYEIVHEESNDQRLVIRDLGPWNEFLTITNSVEAVVSQLRSPGILRDRRLMYYDSRGRLDEIVLNAYGRVLGFRPVETEEGGGK